MAIKFNDGVFGNETITFEIIVCYKCNVPFMVTAAHRQRLLSTHESFYCPAGHSQYYTGTKCEVDKEKLEKELKDQKDWVDKLEENNLEIIRENWDLKKQVLELRKVACPTCGKKIIDLAKHIKKYHSNGNGKTSNSN